MENSLEKKYRNLQDIIKGYGSLLVAFSGGLDSTFLLKSAHDLLGENVLAVTARSSAYPEREFKEAASLARMIGARHLVIESEELDIPGFSNNPANRCYFCKKELFSKLIDIARKEEIKFVADGSNIDDLGDFRPGTEAAAELGIVSPLKEAKMTKSDIRKLSAELKLPTWDKPSFACLSSRFPYGQKITAGGLKMVDEAEDFIIGLGFKQVRVRHHGEIARIEVETKDIVKFLDPVERSKITKRLKELGFKYVSLDLEGYRTGSMNIISNRKPVASNQ